MSSRELWRFTFLTCLLCISASLYAQKEGFVRTKGALYEQGKVLYSKSNPREVTLLTNGNSRTNYLAIDIKSFGFFKRAGKDSTIYESANIEIGGKKQFVFLRRLAGGKSALLSYEQEKARYFYRVGEEIRPLTKGNYKAILRKLTEGKPEWIYQVNKIAFNRTHLSMFFFTLNSDGRDVINLPKTQVLAASVTGDMEFSRLVGVNPFLDELPIDVSQINFGLAHYFPFSEKKRLGLLNHLVFEQYQLYGERRTGPRDQSVQASFDRLSFETALSYRLTTKRLAPYLLAGISFSYLFNDQSEIFEASFSEEDEIIFDFLESPIQHKAIHLGYSFGAGLDVIVSSSVVISLEYRYTDSARRTGNIERITTNQFIFKIGL